MTTLIESIGKITTRDELSEFISQLSKDFEENKSEWENRDLGSFLEAMSAWIDVMDSYYENKGEEAPQDVPWKVFADILYAAKIYE